MGLMPRASPRAPRGRGARSRDGIVRRVRCTRERARRSVRRSRRRTPAGCPSLATGRGGPLDLVRMGIDGWLYRPGDLDDLRMRVTDLAGDARKRRAFGDAGWQAVQGRSWASVCDQLLVHFDDAKVLRAGGLRSHSARRMTRPEIMAPVEPRRWQRYVALGDSLTEGLCDPAPDGALRGWADRLALLLACARGTALREPRDPLQARQRCERNPAPSGHSR